MSSEKLGDTNFFYGKQEIQAMITIEHFTKAGVL